METALVATTAIGVLRVTGPDARAFLHAQLTQDVASADMSTARYGAWLDAKGRVLVCLTIVPTDDGFDLLAPAALLDGLMRRMRLYVLRARVDLTVIEDPGCHALIGETAPWLDAAGIALVNRDGAVSRHGTETWIRISPSLVYAYPLHRDTAHGAADNADAVDAAEIALGRPQIAPATSGEFTAHMLNLDRLDAVAFDKGCYPGQEVVARTHNLGTPKRRMFGFNAHTPAAPGDEIMNASDDAVGRVVRAAAWTDRTRLLAVIRVDALAGPLTLAGSEAVLERHPVPGEPDV